MFARFCCSEDNCVSASCKPSADDLSTTRCGCSFRSCGSTSGMLARIGSTMTPSLDSFAMKAQPSTDLRTRGATLALSGQKMTNVRIPNFTGPRLTAVNDMSDRVAKIA